MPVRLALLSSSTSVGTVAFLVAGEALQSYGQLHPSHCPGVSHGGEEKKETEQAGMHLADSLSVHEAPTRVPLPPHWGLGTGAGGGGTRVLLIPSTALSRRKHTQQASLGSGTSSEQFKSMCPSGLEPWVGQDHSAQGRGQGFVTLESLLPLCSPHGVQ